MMPGGVGGQQNTPHEIQALKYRAAGGHLSERDHRISVDERQSANPTEDFHCHREHGYDLSFCIAKLKYGSTAFVVPHPFRALSRKKPRYGVSVSSSVFLLILAVRSSFSQLKGLPLMARIMVLNSTTEKTWR